ncbi:unnamed protein product [Closterium sp. NIES-54]
MPVHQAATYQVQLNIHASPTSPSSPDIAAILPVATHSLPLFISPLITLAFYQLALPSPQSRPLPLSPSPSQLSPFTLPPTPFPLHIPLSTFSLPPPPSSVPSSPLCSIFAGNSACQLHLEQVVCANGCDPESGNYLQIVDRNTKGILSVCSDYSSVVYESCKDLPLPGFGTMADFFPTKELFMTKLFGAVIGLIGKLNYTVKIKPGPDACYNGPKALPATTLCCDPLKVPRTCPRGTISFKENPEFRPFVGRQIDSKGCTENPSLAMLGSTPDAGAAGKKSAAGGGGRGRGAVLGLVLSWLGVWLACGGL